MLEAGRSTFRRRGPCLARAVQLLTEAQDGSRLLFLRNSGRKTASHFSWNCSRGKGGGCFATFCDQGMMYR
ncbi:hypothetical protein ELH75_22650 [Rhizobium leguminosarum]|uniref:Uncharacterized protein n=1 Tax=Rhizobium leguminosarum TaxID=384 RepID=A0A7M3E422_RHILE|nr:hypothetical protein ELI50_19920 [Rhizobium leguminosarum]TAU43532.1 hypothetical protein ELI51_20645 [Rhizobium leguminosarum]TAY55615.1 hypothetical protein ELH90_23985 [Rhizobium leguminosarum]TAZ64700.1 hypothetical protein ELH75_22650 [Rhizobium leguminosarum]